MDERRREELRRRYLSLGLGELTAAAVFAGAAALLPCVETRRESAALWSALLPLLAILGQAGAYWLLARTWVGRAPMPTTLARLYRAFRVLNPLALVAGLAGVVAWWPGPGLAALLLAVWFFAVAEYLNYYVVRLSYPLRRWPSQVRRWQTPRLVQDLRAAT